MPRNRHFLRRPRLSIAKQQWWMGAEWPDFTSRIERSVLTSVGVVQPTAVTRAYRVRLVYRDGGVPKLYVLSPKLQRRPEAPDTPIPHTFDYLKPGHERPCLYYPKQHEWAPDMPLATSVMPWLLSWLLDYEHWYATGEWLGGGVPHGSTKRAEPPGGENAA